MDKRNRVLLPDELRKFVRSAKKSRRFSLEFAFNTGMTPLELIRISKNIESLFNEDECSIKILSQGPGSTGDRTLFLTESFSDSLAINLDKLEYPAEVITRKRLRVTIPKYQTWNQWYKRLALKSEMSNPEEIRLMTNRYTWGYYLYKSGVNESTVSEQLGLTEDVKFYKSFRLSNDPNIEDIKRYTYDWKGYQDKDPI